MNPFALSGPEFLVFFAIAIAVVVLSVLLCDLVLLQPSGSISPVREDLDPYELAYLSGGADAATDAAVVSLVHAGQLLIDEVGHLALGTDPDAKVGMLTYRSNQSSQHELELAVFAAVSEGSRSLEQVRSQARVTAEGLETLLVSRGLWLSRFKHALGSALGTGWLGGGLCCVGAARIVQGTVHGRPILVLTIFVGGLAFYVYKRRSRFPRLTHPGMAVLRDQQTENQALEVTAMSEPAQLDSREMALAYGLFGATVLGGNLAPLADQVRPLTMASPLDLGSLHPWGTTPGSWWSSGSGSGSGSGCGSSCGSSCGGGGGGCGGGCGGCSS